MCTLDRLLKPKSEAPAPAARRARDEGSDDPDPESHSEGPRKRNDVSSAPVHRSHRVPSGPVQSEGQAPAEAEPVNLDPEFESRPHIGPWSRDHRTAPDVQRSC